MSRRGPSKRDANHDEMVRLFESLGCSVFECHDVGAGFTDLVVGCMGVTLLVEVKTPEGMGRSDTLTPAQQRFHRDWRGQLAVVSTRDDVVRLVTDTRARAGRKDAAVESLRLLVDRIRRQQIIPRDIMDEAQRIIEL